MKTLLCCAFFISIAASTASGQALPTTDPLIGVWKLNLDKSKNPMPVPDSEVITILGEGSLYKLTFEVKYRSNNSKFDVVTDMRGGIVKSVNTDESGKKDTWRVTRQSTNRFEMELKTSFGGRTDTYEISADGKTMTLHRHPTDKGTFLAYTEKNGTLRRLPEQVLVFDRVE